MFFCVLMEIRSVQYGLYIYGILISEKCHVVKECSLAHCPLVI